MLSDFHFLDLLINIFADSVTYYDDYYYEVHPVPETIKILQSLTYNLMDLSEEYQSSSGDHQYISKQAVSESVK